MKRLMLIVSLTLACGSIFSMQPEKQQEEVFHLGHPCLPEEFYREMYTEILSQIRESQDAKDGLQEFVDARLENSLEAYKNNTSTKWRCDLMAGLVSVHASNYNRDDAAKVISRYGHMVPELCVFAVRKKLGVRVQDQIEAEKWELKQISEEEYGALLDQHYQPEDLDRAIVTEEIHAHRMLYKLAGFKAKSE